MCVSYLCSRQVIKWKYKLSTSEATATQWGWQGKKRTTLGARPPRQLLKPWCWTLAYGPYTRSLQRPFCLRPISLAPPSRSQFQTWSVMTFAPHFTVIQRPSSSLSPRFFRLRPTSSVEPPSTTTLVWNSSLRSLKQIVRPFVQWTVSCESSQVARLGVCMNLLLPSAYFIYMRFRRPQLASHNPDLSTRHLSQTLGREWSLMSSAQKAPWKELTEYLMRAFKQKFPKSQYDRATNRSGRSLRPSSSPSRSSWILAPSDVPTANADFPDLAPRQAPQRCAPERFAPQPLPSSPARGSCEETAERALKRPRVVWNNAYVRNNRGSAGQ